MPIMMLPNTGIETAVSRPVTLDIADQVMEILHLKTRELYLRVTVILSISLAPLLVTLPIQSLPLVT